jgi:chromosome partitioning protein
MQVVSVINYKGGVAKTTLTANLGALLAERGKHVLLIDFDPQTSLTLSFYSPEDWENLLGPGQSIKSWFDAIDAGQRLPLSRFVKTPPKAKGAITGGGRLDLIASHFELMQVDLKLVAAPRGNSIVHLTEARVRTHEQLAVALRDSFFGDYDYVLIDCPPNFNMATQIALIASKYVLIPARPDYLSNIGFVHLERTLRALVREHKDRRAQLVRPAPAFVAPRILGVVFTMLQHQAVDRPYHAQKVWIEYAKGRGLPLFDATFRFNNGLFANAGESGVPVALAPVKGQEAVADDLRRITDEFLTRITANQGMDLS